MTPTRPTSTNGPGPRPRSPGGQSEPDRRGGNAMRLTPLHNRWLSHVGCVALRAALCAGAWDGGGAWREAELSRSLHGRWTLETAHADPAVQQVDVEYRPDGTFLVWRTGKDGSVQIVEHGRWWVSGRQLLQEYDVLDGHPVAAGAQ